MKFCDIKPCACPKCGKQLEASSSFGGDGPPVPGDFVICAACLEPAVVSDDLTLNILDVSTLADEDQKNIQDGQKALKRLKATLPS